MNVKVMYVGRGLVIVVRMSVVPHLVEYFNGFLAGILSKFGDLVSWLADGGNTKSACATKDYNVEQGVGSCCVKMIVDELTI